MHQRDTNISRSAIARRVHESDAAFQCSKARSQERNFVIRIFGLIIRPGRFPERIHFLGVDPPRREVPDVFRSAHAPSQATCRPVNGALNRVVDPTWTGNAANKLRCL